MLEALQFKNVGPADELSIELKPRMNFLAGDNGLGKSFLLDVAWWALTRTCARGTRRPSPFRGEALPPPYPFFAYISNRSARTEVST